MKSYLNLNIFIHENAFENVVWKIAAILSRPQCVIRAMSCLQCNVSWSLLILSSMTTFLMIFSAYSDTLFSNGNAVSQVIVSDMDFH